MTGHDEREIKDYVKHNPQSLGSHKMGKEKVAAKKDIVAKKMPGLFNPFKAKHGGTEKEILAYEAKIAKKFKKK